MWEALVRVLQLAIVPIMTEPSHKEALNVVPDGPGSEGVRFVAHGLLGLRSDSRLEQALASQAGALQHLHEGRTVFGEAISDYSRAVSKFWQATIDHSPFRFRSPRQVHT